MTIAGTYKEVEGVVKKHHVYGAEAVINALVFGSVGEAYINKEALHRMIDSAYERLAWEEAKS